MLRWCSVHCEKSLRRAEQALGDGNEIPQDGGDRPSCFGIAFAPASATEELSANKLLVEAEFPVGSDIIGFGFGSAWGVSGKRLVRIQPADNSVVEIELAMRHIDAFRCLAFGEGAVWLVDITESKLLQLDPETNQLVKEIPAPLLSGQGSIGIGEGSRMRGLRVPPETPDPLAHVSASG